MVGTAEADLHAAVVAAPADDAPRLVYADWLMQRGDPRGELIALQCAIARADAADEPIDPALLAREAVLVAAHDAEWFVPLLDVVDATYELRRGFVEHAAADRAVDLDAVGPAWAERAPLLRSIAIRGSMLSAPPTPAWARFEAIELQDVCYLTDDEVRSFADSPHLANLRRLHLNASLEPHLTFALVDLAAPLVHLGLWNEPRYQQPVFDGMPLLARIAARGWPLRSLFLGSCALPDLAALEHLRLERLALHGTRTPISAIHALAASRPTLTTLELDHDGGDPVPIDLPALLEALPALRRLSVRGAQLTDRDAFALAECPAAARLRRLDLSRNLLGLDGVRALARSEHLAGLTWLCATSGASDVESDEVARLCARPAVFERPRRGYHKPVLDEVRAGMLIAAIKYYREWTGEGLLMAKVAVERIADELGLRPRKPISTPTWVGLAP